MGRAASRSPDGKRRRAGAFTLIEVLVTMVVLLLVLVTLMQFMTRVDQAWKSAAADPFAEAENGFETIANSVAHATLEPYQDYADSTGVFGTATPDHLARRSDLAFVCGPSSGSTGLLTGSGRITAGESLFFVAPQGYTQSEAHLGLERLLNALGYFVEFSDEADAPAFILPDVHRWRWRLKEVVQPAELLGIFTTTTSLAWVQPAVKTGAPNSILAENIVALVVLPEGSASDTAAPAFNYQYDSRDPGDPLTRNQLPARLRLLLVAIDEASAQILAAQDGTNPPALLPDTLFTDATKWSADLASLDAGLTAQKIGHRLFQREILLPSAAWTETLSQ
jgi:uncharacterized protein (TIGR02599 family)